MSNYIEEGIAAAKIPIGIRHTIYVTSGQTVVVVGDQLEEAGRIYYVHAEQEVASFKKDFIAGITSDYSRSAKKIMGDAQLTYERSRFPRATCTEWGK